jgi:5-methyltetrahydropteroyltriglutamate--homocysteine methyltransferase
MTKRILTTHVGSLPRSAAVTDLVFAQERGEAIDAAQFSSVIGAAVGDSPRSAPKDLEMFPSFLERQSKGGGTPTYRRPKCVGPIAVKSMEPLEDDIAHMNAAVAAHKPTGSFMNSASPGVIALFQPNEFYPSQDAYLETLAEAMRPEYEAIVAAGLYLQLDSPDLGLGRHMMYKDRSDAEYLTLIGGHVEALNHALRNVPADRVRMHVCWGNYEGPHCCDVEMGVILPTLMSAKPAALLFETSNPRHAADWNYFVEMADIIPEDKILIPGVIDSTTNFIEHPRVVAERIERYANIIGRERVIAGTDCGFSTFAGFGVVDPEIVYAKLKTLAEGAELASKKLW